MTDPRRVTMVDQCVRAMVKCEHWSSFFGEDDARAFVLIVLAELREPSTGMFLAGVDACEGSIASSDAEAIWQAMIDYARLGRGRARI